MRPSNLSQYERYYYDNIEVIFTGIGDQRFTFLHPASNGNHAWFKLTREEVLDHIYDDEPEFIDSFEDLEQ